MAEVTVAIGDSEVISKTGQIIIDGNELTVTTECCGCWASTSDLEQILAVRDALSEFLAAKGVV